MIALTLSAAAVFVLLALAWHGLARRSSPGDVSLGCVALLLAGGEAAERFALVTAAPPLSVWRIASLIESLLPAALLWYGFTFARRDRLQLLSLKGLMLAAAAVVLPAWTVLAPVDAFFYAPDIQSEGMLFLNAAGYWFYLLLLLACIAALMNLEGTLASSGGSDRSKITYEIAAMGSMLAVLIFYFSQGLLYRTIDVNLLPVRSTVFIIAGSMVLGSKLLRGNGVHVAVSRTLVYRSASALAVGAYLVVLALAGEGLRYLALPFGRYLAILLAFAAGAGLLLTLLSQRLRRKWKVVISKHFFSHKHDYRQTWLNLTGRLGSCRTRSEMEDAILHIYEQIFGLGAASLYIADARSGRFVPSGHPLSTAFTASRNLLFYFRDRNRIWDPRDGEYIPVGEEADFLGAVRPRVVVPLICNQRVEGLLVFKTGPVDERFTYDDYDLMKTIAQQCALLLANMRLSEELVETGELAAMARVSSFVVHDLKNLTQTLSLTIDNAEEHMGNRAFQEDLMITIRHTVGNMKRLTQKLKILPGSGRPGACADLRTLCLEILEEFAKTLPEASLIWRGEPVSCSVAPDELRSVIVNLVQNGLDSAGASGTIIVEAGLYDGQVFLKVSDNGPGMSREFMQYQLFRAFRSTKHAGLGIGLYQCRQTVESWGGTIEASSDEGKGACFTVRLPARVRTLVSVA